MYPGPGWMWLNAGEVARQGIRDCERGNVLSVPSLRYRTLSTVARRRPARVLRAVSSRFKEDR